MSNVYDNRRSQYTQIPVLFFKILFDTCGIFAKEHTTIKKNNSVIRGASKGLSTHPTTLNAHKAERHSGAKGSYVTFLYN